MKPTVAVQASKDAAARDAQFAKDWPDLQSKSEMDRLFSHMGVFCEVDRHFRFRLVYDVEDRHMLHPMIADMKTGEVLEEPPYVRPDDPEDILGSVKTIMWNLAYEIALQHRNAVWALEADLREQEQIAHDASFTRLMKMAGYDYKDGKLMPTEEKARELIQRNLQLAMDDIFGKGWKK